jgi:hypothetical protein
MHLLSIPPPPTSPTAWTRREIELYTKAAHDLASAFASTQVAGDEFTTWDALRVWPMQLSIPFLNLVKESHPTALILLAHYCILLKKVEGHWYFKGRATRLLRSILKHLGREWWEFIRWPLEEIGVQVDREGEDKEME